YSGTPPLETYTLSLHDALPIYGGLAALQRGEGRGLHERGHERAGRLDHGRRDARSRRGRGCEAGQEPDHAGPCGHGALPARDDRSEEHTSELQSRENLVCRLLL